MLKLTAPDGSAVEVNPAFIENMFPNTKDGEGRWLYHHDAKTVLQILGQGIQAVKESMDEIDALKGAK